MQMYKDFLLFKMMMRPYELISGIIRNVRSFCKRSLEF